MLLKTTLLLSLLCCTLPMAHADDASKQTKIQELFRLEKLDQISKQSMQRAMDMMNNPAMVQRMSGVQLPPGQQQAMQQLSGKLFPILSSALSWENVEPDYIKLYANAFTEKQIDDMIAFYKSPTGQAFAEKEPMLVQQQSAIAQQRLIGIMPEIQKTIKDFADQQKEKAKPQPATPNQ